MLFGLGRTLDIKVFHRLGMSAEPGSLDMWFDRQQGDTIFDGELVKEYVKDSLNPEAALQEEYVLLVFDVIAVNGKNVSIDADLRRRLTESENWLVSPYGPNRSEVPLPFSIRPKAMRDAVDIQGVLRSMTMDTHERCWHYKDDRAENRYHHSDGLVFTPSSEIYHDSLALKWKPAEMTSVDFSVSVNDIKGALFDVKRGRFDSKFPGACAHGNMMITLATIGIVDEADAYVISPVWSIEDEKKKNIIIECTFDKDSGLWRPFRLRTDKASPNSVQTAWTTLEVASASMNVSELVEKISSAGSQKVPTANGGKRMLSAHERKVLFDVSSNIIQTKVGAGDSGDIASHYDSIQTVRNAKNGKDKRMDMLRKVNNWAKAGMFMLILSQSNSKTVMSVGDVTAALSRLESHGRALVLDETAAIQALGYSPQVSPMLLQSPVSKEAKKSFQYLKRNDRIKALDICCGRGGDLNKLTREFVLDLYVGIDLSLQELKEAEVRATQMSASRKNPKKFIFIHGDAAASETNDVLDVLSGRRAEQPLEGVKVPVFPGCSFDLAFCQFALHYFCDDRERLGNILRTVSESLKPGHRFCASFPNPFHVSLRLQGLQPRDSDPSSLCTIRPASTTEGNEIEAFGVEYIFTLGDAVQNCKEFVVPLPLVIEMARDVGLSLVLLVPMQDFILSMLDHPETNQLRLSMSVLPTNKLDRPLSDEEWAAIGVYCIAAWEKTA